MRIAVKDMVGIGKSTIAKQFALIFESLGFDATQIKAIEWKLWKIEDEALTPEQDVFAKEMIEVINCFKTKPKALRKEFRGEYNE